jgi:hypothetical protein
MMWAAMMLRCSPGRRSLTCSASEVALAKTAILRHIDFDQEARPIVNRIGVL